MTEIQAIIDKLEAEADKGAELYDYNYCGGIEFAITELKKHLPKEDKSSFEVPNHDGRGLPLVKSIKGTALISDNLYVLEIGILPDELICFAKKDLPTIISALQAAHEEMEDEG